MKRTLFLAVMLITINAAAQDTLATDVPRFSKHFAEAKLIFGPVVEQDDYPTQFNTDAGIGIQYSNLSDRWGWYGGLAYIDGKYKNYVGVTGGAVYRVSDISSKIDFQVYSGLSCGLGLNSDNRLVKYPGLDAGLRIAPGAKVRRSRFAWTSFSLGMTHFYNKPVFTFGLSISLTPIPAVGYLLLDRLFH